MPGVLELYDPPCRPVVRTAYPLSLLRGALLGQVSLPLADDGGANQKTLRASSNEDGKGQGDCLIYLRVKKWAEFQHYKDRNPPWIKLHRTLLDDYEFSCLQDASKLHLILIWVLASQNDGRIPEDAAFLQKRLSLSKPPDLETLINQGFLIREQDASNALAEGKQGASNLRLEKRREETEKMALAFARFWDAYPKKVAKPNAIKAFKSAALQNGDFERAMAALEVAKASEQWSRDDGKFIPHPATWLRQRRFDDEQPTAKKVFPL